MSPLDGHGTLCRGGQGRAARRARARAQRAHVACAVRALSVRAWAGGSMHVAPAWLCPGCVRRVG
eukprot:4648902-Pleurochrysis_carterae.AAC.1